MRLLAILLITFSTTASIGQVRFKSHPIAVGNFSSTNSEERVMKSNDLDNDGDNDIIQLSEADGAVYWYENLDGQGTFSNQKTIANDLTELKSMEVSDIDGDQDLDIICVTSNGGELIIYLNQIQTKEFKEYHTYIPKKFKGIGAINCIDVDNDSDVDLLIHARSDGASYFLENVGGKNVFLDEQVAFQHKGLLPFYVPSFKTLDIDGDGFLDVFAYSMGNIAWFKNRSGKGKFTLESIITNYPKGGNSSILVGNFDSNKELDLVYRNALKQHTYHIKDFAKITRIDSLKIPYGLRGFALLDKNNDGIDEFISYENSKLYSYRNGYAEPTQLVIAKDSRVLIGDREKPIFEDLDGDKRKDLITINDKGIFWMKNSNAGFENPNAIALSSTGSRDAIHVDIDQDGDLDLLSKSPMTNNLVLFRNTNGKGKFIEEPISSLPKGINHFQVGDYDDDGDLDISITAYLRNQPEYQFNDLLFFMNIEGKGVFEKPVLKANLGEKANYFLFHDFNKDGKLDLMTTSMEESTLTYFNNFEVNGVEDKILVSRNVDEIISLEIIDMNKDGFEDLIVTCSYNSRVSVFYFDNDDNKFGKEVILTKDISKSHNVGIADFNQDGKLDFAISSPWHNKVSYFKNSGRDRFKEVVVSTNHHIQRKVEIGDINNDSFPDILTTARDDAKDLHTIVWYEMKKNKDPVKHLITDKISFSNFAKLCDVDGDGDLDVYVGSKEQFYWFENLVIE